MFEGLPERFTGNQFTTIHVNTWINKFKLVGEIKSWVETTQLKILELWLEGKAYEWFSLFKQKNEKLSIKTALLGLATEYSNKHSGSLKDLMEIKVLPEETVLEFNKRFLDNWSTIPVSHYTEEIVRDTYLSKLSDLDRKVWWNLIPTAENKTTKTLIQESDSYARVKTKYSNTANKKPENISKLDKKYNRIAKSSKENDPMDELTQSIKELILLSKKSLEVRRNPPKCQNCGRRAHATDKYFAKTSINTAENKTAQPPSTSMIALAGESNKTDLDCYSDSTNEINTKLVAASDNKIIRVGNLVNNDYSQITRRVTLD
ncbi:hypothetical protein BB561_004170 [Smittium simulii]|uniref:Retrotransposon gag domain-containing protein n=1 Tax=Smittium simulii TaxID=133385 RepID=A0A2T9YHN1_9FUNG|nr:hypothetical protein BB561_004170 [Smittium simulii]